jgi:hypothetical protein
LPVSSAVAAAVGITSRFVCSASFTTPRAIAECGMPMIMSTCTCSYQRRAIPTPTSTLFCMSAKITSIGLPSTDPPKSATAIRTASTSPGPVLSE